MQATSTRPGITVTTDGVGVVSHAGSRLVADVADRITLTLIRGQRRSAPRTWLRSQRFWPQGTGPRRRVRPRTDTDASRLNPTLNQNGLENPAQPQAASQTAPSRPQTPESALRQAHTTRS